MFNPGHETGFKDDVSHEIPRLTVAMTEFDSNRMQEKHKYDTGRSTMHGNSIKTRTSYLLSFFIIKLSMFLGTEALKLESNRFVEFIKQSCGSHEGTDFEFPIRNQKCNARNPTKICQREKHASMDEQQELVIASGISISPRLNDEAGNAVKEQTKGHDDLVLNERDYASSESFEILVENNLQDHHQDKSGGSHRRKTRKVRLLTELLFDNGDGKTSHISAEDSPSNEINSASAMVEIVSVPQGQVSLQENLRGGLDDNKKRKLLHDGEWRSPQMSFPNNINKKVKDSNGNGETATGIADSEIEKDRLGGICLQTDMTSYWNKCRIDRGPIIGKKKNKKTQVTDACLPLAQTEEILPKKILDKVGISSTVNVDSGILPRLMQDASAARGMDQILLPAPRKVRKSSLYKKKNKMPQVDDGQAPRNNEGDPTSRKDVEIIQTAPLTVSFQPVEDASTGKGPHLSLGNYLVGQSYDRRYIPQVENGLPNLLPWHKASSKVDEAMRNDVVTNYVANSRVPSKSASYAFLGKELHGELNSRLATYGMPVPNDKRKYNSQVGEAYHSQMQQRVWPFISCFCYCSRFFCYHGCIIYVIF